MDLRIGQGIDFHRLESGRELWLGGILIDSDLGSVAHSDGDVLIHAICDALLGAAGLKDIGHHFPDNDNRFKGIDSKKLLADSVSLVHKEGFSIINIDSTVCLESPRLSSYIDRMKDTLGRVTGTDPARIGIKATTTERMGFTGRGEGIVALAVVLLAKT